VDALIGVERLLEEKGTTPEPGGGARIPAGRGRDTPHRLSPSSELLHPDACA